MNSAACSPSDKQVFFLLHPKGCKICDNSNTSYVCPECKAKRTVTRSIINMPPGDSRRKTVSTLYKKVPSTVAMYYKRNVRTKSM